MAAQVDLGARRRIGPAGPVLRRFTVGGGRYGRAISSDLIAPSPASRPLDSRAVFWADADRHLVRYGPAFTPEIIIRAEGAYLYTDEGRRLLDFTSGQMSAILGRSQA